MRVCACVCTCWVIFHIHLMFFCCTLHREIVPSPQEQRLPSSQWLWYSIYRSSILYSVNLHLSFPNLSATPADLNVLHTDLCTQVWERPVHLWDGPLFCSPVGWPHYILPSEAWERPCAQHPAGTGQHQPFCSSLLFPYKRAHPSSHPSKELSGFSQSQHPL